MLTCISEFSSIWKAHGSQSIKEDLTPSIQTSLRPSITAASGTSSTIFYLIFVRSISSFYLATSPFSTTATLVQLNTTNPKTLTEMFATASSEFCSTDIWLVGSLPLGWLHPQATLPTSTTLPTTHRRFMKALNDISNVSF